MAINNICFTYPILSNFNNDFINVNFIAGSNGILEKTKKYSKIKTYVEINDNNINELLDNGKAKIIVKIYCKSTKYREIKEIKRGNDEIQLLNIDINNNVELNTFILANENIKGYSSSNFNLDFKGKRFDIEKGSILAIGKNENLFIEKDIIDLTKLNSVIKISDIEKNNVPMEVEYNEEYIIIYLSSEDCEIYSKYSKYSTSIINSMIIIPALIYVLDEISKPDIDINEFVNKKWYRVLTKKLSELLGKDFKVEYIRTQGSLKLIQKLFDNLLSDGLKELENLHGGN